MIQSLHTRYRYFYFCNTLFHLVTHSQRKSSADSVGILDTFADRFMQFLEENKDSEGMLGNAAKFIIEKAEEHSLDR